MASIMTRTVYIDNREDQVRFFDWCVVGTSLGTMIEPRQMMGFIKGAKAGFANYDPLDECSKITRIESVDRRNKFAFLGAGLVLHGGEQVPQSYVY